MTLRHLAGGSYLDIMEWAKIHSTRTFYRHVRRMLVDMDACLPALTFDTDLRDPERHSAGTRCWLRASLVREDQGLHRSGRWPPRAYRSPCQ